MEGQLAGLSSECTLADVCAALGTEQLDRVVMAGGETLLQFAALHDRRLLSVLLSDARISSDVALCAEAAIVALAAEGGRESFRSIWTRNPQIVEYTSPTLGTCYRVLVQVQALDVLCEALQGEKKALSHEALESAFPALQRLIWARVFSGEFAFVREIDAVLPKTFHLLRLRRSRETVLHEAVRTQPLETLEKIVLAGLISVDKGSAFGLTALMLTVQKFAGSELTRRVNSLLALGAQPLVNDLRFNTAFHYLLRNPAVPSNQKLEILQTLREHSDDFEIKTRLLLVNTANESIFTLAVTAFPQIADFRVWVEFLSEVYELPVEEAAVLPHRFSVVEGSYLTFYTSEVQSKYFRSMTEINSAVQFRSSDPIPKLAYTEDFSKERVVVSPLEIAASQQNLPLLLWLAETAKVDPNWLSYRQPLWLRLLKWDLPDAFWALISGLRISAEKPQWESSKGFTPLVSPLGQEDDYMVEHWLGSALKMRRTGVRKAIGRYLDELQSECPTDYTDHYLATFLGKEGYGALFASLLDSFSVADFEAYIPYERLDQNSDIYAKLVLLLLDSSIWNGLSAAFSAIMSLPRSHELLLNPMRASQRLGIYHLLNLSLLREQYAENVNENFIGNSFLYALLQSENIRADILQTLLDHNLPLISLSLPREQHNFHPFYTLLKHAAPSTCDSAKRKRVREEGVKCVRLLGEAMLQRAPLEPVYYSELAVGVDVTLDDSLSKRRRAHFSRDWDNRCLKAAEPKTLLQLVLSHPDKPLFGRIYTFARHRTEFWSRKTVDLLSSLTALGAYEELKETLQQFSDFAVANFPAAPFSPLPELGCISTDFSLEAFQAWAVAELLTLPQLKFRPRSACRWTDNSRCLAVFLTNIGVLQTPEHSAIRQIESVVRFAQARGEWCAGEKLERITLHSLFASYFAFARHKGTTFLHYLAKREELTPFLVSSLSGLNGRVRAFFDFKRRCLLGVAAYSANLLLVQTLVTEFEWRLPTFAEGSSPLLLALEGRLGKVKREVTAGGSVSPAEAAVRLRCFRLLHSRLPATSRPCSDTEDTAYDALFYTEKVYMRGTASSRFGSCLAVAAAFYPVETVSELLAMGLSPCFVHSFQRSRLRKRGKDRFAVQQTVQTCALREALTRNRWEVALILARELALKYSESIRKHSELYASCARTARMKDLAEVSSLLTPFLPQ